MCCCGHTYVTRCLPRSLLTGSALVDSDLQAAVGERAPLGQHVHFLLEVRVHHPHADAVVPFALAFFAVEAVQQLVRPEQVGLAPFELDFTVQSVLPLPLVRFLRQSWVNLHDLRLGDLP